MVSRAAGSRAAGAAGPAGAYARALFTVAEAEGVLERVEDELFRFARAVEGDPALRDRLVDPGLEIAPKLAVVDGVLAGRAHPQTVSAALFVVQAGRARLLTEIADELVRLSAESRAHAVAEVRTAVSLSDQQRRRLADALSEATGQAVELKVIIDEQVVGGVVVRMGDTVIDGTVARRLAELRSRLAGT